MVPQNLRFGGGAADSTIVPLMAVLLLLTCVLILVLPRQKAITPFLIGCFLIPSSQVVVLGGMHLPPIRVLALVALVRRAAASEGEKYPHRFNTVDRAVFIWLVTSVIAFILEFPGIAAVMQGAGNLVEMVGGYVALRFFISDGVTVRRALKVMVVICVIEGIAMIIEHITRVNVLCSFGGSWVGATIRDGKVRASGTMGFLTAGPLAGTFIPLFLWLWKDRERRITAYAGIAGALAMVIASNSSTSQLALGGSIIGLCFWRLRSRMRQVRWILVCTLIALHLCMKAPVWALIARVDLTGSSSGWHRFFIVDMTIRHFSQWWLIGTPDFVNWGWDAYDTCNQFADIALKGGLAPLIFYILAMSRSFGMIGKARKAVQGQREIEWYLWCIGSSLFAVVVAQWGIMYYDMLRISLFIIMATASVAASEASRRPNGESKSRKPQDLKPVGTLIGTNSLVEA